MDISYLGHSCFQIKGSQTVVVTDPVSPESGYEMGKTSAGIVTVSHSHPGHSNTAGIGGEPKIVKGPGEYEISGVLVIGISTFHDAEKGSQRGKNTVYLMEMDEISVCHLGDLGHMLTADQLEELGEVDVLMVPVGGVSTINAVVAAEITRQLEPKIVLPMHYQSGTRRPDLGPVSGFLKETGADQITPQPKLSLSRSHLPLTTQVVLLDF